MLIQNCLAKKNKPFSWLDYISNFSIFRQYILKEAEKKVKKVTKGKMPAPIKIIDSLKNSHKMTLDSYLTLESNNFADLIETKESKALIVPSIYGEGLSRVVLEASYIGIPTLATKIRGIEEILPKDYKYFIKSNNPFSIAQQLAEMINDNKYFDSIKESLKSNIKKNYSTEKSIMEFTSNVFKS